MTAPTTATTLHEATKRLRHYLDAHPAEWGGQLHGINGKQLTRADLATVLARLAGDTSVQDELAQSLPRVIAYKDAGPAEWGNVLHAINKQQLLRSDLDVAVQALQA